MQKEIKSRAHKSKHKQKRKRKRGENRTNHIIIFFFFFFNYKKYKEYVESNVQKYQHVIYKHKPDELLYIFSKFLKESI